MKGFFGSLAVAAALCAAMSAWGADATGGAGKNGTALTGSQANLQAAKDKVNADKDKLDQMMKHRQELFEQSPEYARAQKAFEDALAAAKAARDAVLAKLQTQKAYTDAKARADAAERAAKGGGQDLAQRALEADGVVSKIEGAAFSMDDTVKTADGQLKTARTALQKLKDDFAMKMKYDDHLVAQRDAIAKDQREADSWAARVQELQSPTKKKK
jgi:hypothetical protein